MYSKRLEYTGECQSCSLFDIPVSEHERKAALQTINANYQRFRKVQNNILGFISESYLLCFCHLLQELFFAATCFEYVKSDVLPCKTNNENRQSELDTARQRRYEHKQRLLHCVHTNRSLTAWIILHLAWWWLRKLFPYFKNYTTQILGLFDYRGSAPKRPELHWDKFYFPLKICHRCTCPSAIV